MLFGPRIPIYVSKLKLKLIFWVKNDTLDSKTSELFMRKITLATPSDSRHLIIRLIGSPHQTLSKSNSISVDVKLGYTGDIFMVVQNNTRVFR